MEFLKTIGFTEAEINGTIEEQTQAFERIKQGIVDNVVNDPKNYNAIAEKTKFETMKIAEKAVIKVFGITAEEGDDFKKLLQKGKDVSSANSSDVLKTLQDDVIKYKAELTKFKDEILPAEIAKEQAKVSEVFVKNDLLASLNDKRFEGMVLQKEHALTMLPFEYEKRGWVKSYDSALGKTVIKTKEGLKPQIGDKTFDYTEITDINAVLLDTYLQKSNGGAQGGGAGQGGVGFQNTGAGAGTGHVLSPAEQKLQDELAKVKV